MGYTYEKYRLITETCILIYKRVGYTPLQVLEEIRTYLDEESSSKCTYVGRLDPMAEGYIHILWSGDMNEKKELSSLDKEYIVDVLLNIKTDTDDILGLVIEKDIIQDNYVLDFKKYIGPFNYDYPKYSSPNIKKVLQGKDFVFKKQDGYIYNIELLNNISIHKNDLEKMIFDKLSLCKMPGDFRFDIIKEGWKNFFINTEKENFSMFQIKVKCKSATYMRVLAREMGGLAFSIRRDLFL